MPYKLTIIKTVPNPEYDPTKRDQYERMGRYGNDIPPLPLIQDRILEVEVTDDEFRVIKRGVLEVI